MSTPHPFTSKPKNRLWDLINPRTTGILVGSALAAYPSITSDWQIFQSVPDYQRGVPTRVYVLVAGFILGYSVAKGCSWLRKKILKSLFGYLGWIKHPKSIKTKAWGTLLKLLRGPQPYSTFAFQPYLPKQPLPTLDETLDRWLVVAKELVSEDEFELTKEAVEEFRQNEGPKLQNYLLERANKEDNWIFNYWLNVVYLSSRQPLAVHSNYCGTTVLGEHRTTCQLARAAAIAHAMAQFEELITEQKLQPVLIQNLVPLCMSGYRYLFNATRIPGEYKDEIVKHPGYSHIIVIRKGNYYKLDLRYDDDDRSLLTAYEIKQQMEKIVRMADGDPALPPVAALTGQKRDIWAKNRIQLMKNNKDVLNDVETSMFVICLDEKTPKNYAELSKLSLGGQVNNVWFDKCFNYIIYANSWGGSNVDHTLIDAMINITLTEYFLLFETYENGDVPMDKQPRQLESPKRLDWDLSDMSEAIDSAAKDLKQLVDDLDLDVYRTSYGKGFVKKQKISPDGYIQMALQLAFYKIHKTIVRTYEPATGRLFLLGRTETINPISPMSVAWLRAMEDPTSSAEVKIDLLRKAISYQTKYKLDATMGKGCDRHLLALMCASRELGMDFPKIFMDKPWQRPYVLSTSQTPQNMYEYGIDCIYDGLNGGFGPATHEGYGICYTLFGEEQMNFKITSWNSCADTSSTGYAKALEEAFEDMKIMFSQ